MEKIELVKDRTYLVRFGNGETIFSITMLLIAEKAYYIRWNLGLKSYDEWKLITSFDKSYTVLEDITELNNYVDEIIQYQTKWIDCPNCGGSGTVLDSNSTSGDGICNKCWGSGKTIILVNGNFNEVE